MNALSFPPENALSGCAVVITRPAGTGTALARQVRMLGGMPVLLPGLSLRGADDPQQARVQWIEAQQDDVLIFTSPAAVRYALALSPWMHAQPHVIGVGKGTAAALHRHGIQALVPASRQDSEGVLELAPLREPAARRIALITAPGGRGLLQEQLVARGAIVREVYVYRRTAPRLDRRHNDAVAQLPATACVLISSGEALQNLAKCLSGEAWQHLCRMTAIVSSERIEQAARSAGFSHWYRAASAAQADLLVAACEVCSRQHRIE